MECFALQKRKFSGKPHGVLVFKKGRSILSSVGLPFLLSKRDSKWSKLKNGCKWTRLSLLHWRGAQMKIRLWMGTIHSSAFQPVTSRRAKLSQNRGVTESLCFIAVDDWWSRTQGAQDPQRPRRSRAPGSKVTQQLNIRWTCGENNLDWNMADPTWPGWDGCGRNDTRWPERKREIENSNAGGMWTKFRLWRIPLSKALANFWGESKSANGPKGKNSVHYCGTSKVYLTPTALTKVSFHMRRNSVLVVRINGKNGFKFSWQPQSRCKKWLILICRGDRKTMLTRVVFFSQCWLKFCARTLSIKNTPCLFIGKTCKRQRDVRRLVAQPFLANRIHESFESDCSLCLAFLRRQ